MKRKVFSSGKIGIALLALMLSTGQVEALVYTSAQNGDWGNSSTWSPAGVPGMNDTASVNHQVTIDATQSISDVTVSSSGTLICSGAYNLLVYGNWTNNGTATFTSGYVILTGSSNGSIGGSSATTFYRLQVNKGALGVLVTMDQAVTCSYPGSGALNITRGTLVTNGQNLTVNASNSRVVGDANGKLQINGGSTVDISYLYQWGIGYVSIEDSAVVNIARQDIANSGHRFDVLGGTLNYTGTGSSWNLSLYTNNPTWGWYATGGVITFNGSVQGWNGATHFQASGNAVVRFVGSQNSVVMLQDWPFTSPVTSTWRFNDLRIEKTGGAGVTMYTEASNGYPVNSSVTADVGATVESGTSLTLNGTFTGTNGYDFNNITDQGAITQGANHLYVSGDWTGAGSFSPGNKLVTFDGSGSESLALGSGSFYDARVNKPGGSLALGSDIQVEHALTVADGTFAVGENVLTLGTASAPGSVLVNRGAFSVVGTAFANGEVAAADPAQPFGFDVVSGALIGARYANFTNMDGDGISVASGAVIDATDNFSYCRFDHGATSGPMLKVENDQTIDDIAAIDFDGTAGYNIEKLADAGHITVTGGSGNRWGSTYENDPNDRIDWLEFDLGVSAINSPAGSVLENTLVRPEVVITNYGPREATTGVRLIIDDGTDAPVYDTTETGITVPVGQSVTRRFTKSWLATPQQRFSVVSFTTLADMNPANDTTYGEFTVIPPWPFGWSEARSIPAGLKPVKDGGWLAFNEGNGLIYACKGNKSNEFYAYDFQADSWTRLADIPDGPEGKPPKGGSAGAADGENYVYMTKGNNTLGFWRYDIEANRWDSMPDVPEGPSRKRVKGGTSLAHVPAGADDSVECVYLLKGYKTEFYRFNVAARSWEPLEDAPAGAKAKYDKGSWLCYDEAAKLYCHKAKYSEFYVYDLDSVDWGPDLGGIPLVGAGGRRKKPKQGSSGAWYDGEVYALKGGSTCEFWKYTPGAETLPGTWAERETMPQVGSTGKKKKVKDGGDLVSCDNGMFFAFKGGKTSEFWRYVLPLYALRSTPDARQGVTAWSWAGLKPGLVIAPNPVAGGFADLRYSLPGAGPARLVVYDVTGRTVEERVVAAARTGATSLDLRRLAAGVYLVRLEADDLVLTRKLVIQD